MGWLANGFPSCTEKSKEGKWEEKNNDLENEMQGKETGLS